MNVLSLFNGMSCGMLALKKAAIKVDKYYSSEIDKYANQVSQKNFPEIIQIGDVTKVSGFDYDVDLLIAGSPCQGFSFAGKQLNFEDPRSKLFFDFVRILEEVRIKNPNVLFLLENVKMKKEYEKVITDILKVEPIEINSALVSAQNRKRIYWTNIPNIEQPEDKGILLKDIVHEHSLTDRDKSYCIDASYCKGGNLKQYFEKSRRQQVFEVIESFIIPLDRAIQIMNKEYEKGKIKIASSKTDNVVTLNPKKDNGTQTYQQDRIYDIHGKMVCLSAELSGRFNIMVDYDYIFGCITPDRIDKRQNGQRFNDGHKFYTLTAQDKHGILIEGYIRKLTPIECERLQTVPDNFTDCVSNSQRYKMLGNGWTVDIIAHIFKNIGQEPKIIEPTHKPQLALF